MQPVHLDGKFAVLMKDVWFAILGGDKNVKNKLLYIQQQMLAHLTWQSSCMANVALTNPKRVIVYSN